MPPAGGGGQEWCQCSGCDHVTEVGRSSKIPTYLLVSTNWAGYVWDRGGEIDGYLHIS